MKNMSGLSGLVLLYLALAMDAHAQNLDYSLAERGRKYFDTRMASNNTPTNSNALQDRQPINTINHMKAINKNAPVRSRKSITIRATPEKIWAVMTGINDWARWQSDISNPRLTGPLAPSSTFEWKTGGAKIHSTIHTVNPYQQFGWTGKTFGMFAIHNWEVIAKGDQAEVTVEESLEGFFAKLFKKSFNKNLERDMQHWLELLKAESEK